MKKNWCWNIDPRTKRHFGARLQGGTFDIFKDDSYLDYLFLFLPVRYIKEVVIPQMNAYAKQHMEHFEDFTYDEFVNGSSLRIAGICNKEGNVVGMMPHPERATERTINPIDHKPSSQIFESLLNTISVAQ